MGKGPLSCCSPAAQLSRAGKCCPSCFRVWLPDEGNIWGQWREVTLSRSVRLVSVMQAGFGSFSKIGSQEVEQLGKGQSWDIPGGGDRSGPAEARRMLHPDFSLLVIGSQSPPPGGLIFLMNIINIFNKSHALSLPHQRGGGSREEEEEEGLLS